MVARASRDNGNRHRRPRGRGRTKPVERVCAARLTPTELCGTAVLSTLFPRADISLSSDPTVWAEMDIVLGEVPEAVGGDFPNTRFFPRFRRVWKAYGNRYVEVAFAEGDMDLSTDADAISILTQQFSDRFVRPVDGDTRGKTPAKRRRRRRNGSPPQNNFDVVALANSLIAGSGGNEERLEQGFQRAVGIMATALKSQLTLNSNWVIQKRAVEAAEIEGRILILPQWVPLKVVLKRKQPNIRFVVHPSERDKKWVVESLKLDHSKRGPRRFGELPDNWAGKTGEELVAVTSVSTAQSCTSDRKRVIASNKHGATLLAHLADSILRERHHARQRKRRAKKRKQNSS